MEHGEAAPAGPGQVRHYSRRTGEAYVYRIRPFILFHDKRHPAGMGTVEVEAYLTWLAEKRNKAVSTQNQALTPSSFCRAMFLNSRWGVEKE